MISNFIRHTVSSEWQKKYVSLEPMIVLHSVTSRYRVTLLSRVTLRDLSLVKTKPCREVLVGFSLPSPG